MHNAAVGSGVHSAFPFCDLAAQLSRRPERGF
jgi:hypothetical protein